MATTSDSVRPRSSLQLRGNETATSLSPIRFAMLAVAFFAGIAGSYLVYARVSGLNDTPDITANTYVPAFTTNLSTTVSTTGSVEATQETDLGFGVSGEITAINVALGDQVKAGQELASLDDTQLQTSLRSAQANLASAQVRLDTLLNPSAADIASASATVLSAQNQVASTQQALSDLQAKPTATDLAMAQQSVLSAQTSLQNARDAVIAAQNAATLAEQNLNGTASSNTALQSDYTNLSSGDLERAVKSAELGLQTAQQNLTDTLAGATALEISQAQSAIATAQAGLAMAQANYDQMLTPVAADVLPLQAAVDSAADSVATAQKNLSDAVITAPFDGTISALSASVGDSSSATGASSIMTLVNPNLVQITASVDQTDLPNLKVGQPVSVTLDALSGYTYDASISSVGLTPTVTQGVVTYTVLFALDTSALPEGTPVPSPGMTANLTVTTASETNVLVVPSRSVQGTAGAGVVTVKGATGDERRPVTTGITNGTLTQILSGLTEGEEVVYNTTSSSTSSSTALQNQQQNQFTFPGGGIVSGGGTAGGGGFRRDVGP
jgi:HlyD family secretion protein